MNLIGLARFDYSEATKPLAEFVIASTMPYVKDFDWTNEDEDLLPLDLKNGIDLIANCKQGQPLTFQVKCLSKDYHTITIEGNGKDYAGNDKQGDWNTCLAQFQLFVYSDDAKTIQRWCIIDNARLSIASHTKRLHWIKRNNNYSASCFKAIQLTTLMEVAPEVIVSYGGDWKDECGDKFDLHNHRVDI